MSPAAQFCAHCGTPVPETVSGRDGRDESAETMYEQAEQQAERSDDPWEG